MKFNCKLLLTTAFLSASLFACDDIELKNRFKGYHSSYRDGPLDQKQIALNIALNPNHQDQGITAFIVWRDETLPASARDQLRGI